MNPFEQDDPRFELWNKMQAGASAPAPLPSLAQPSADPPVGAMALQHMAALQGAMANPSAQPAPIQGAPEAGGALSQWGTPATHGWDAVKATGAKLGDMLTSGHGEQDYRDSSGNQGLSLAGGALSAVDSVNNYAKFQRNVMSGAYGDNPISNPQAAADGAPAAFNLVGTLGAGGMSRAATTGAAGEVGIFGGRGALAQTPRDAAIADAAQSAIQGGANNNAVRQASGWFQGVDGQMRKEISDQGAGFTHEAFAPGINGKMGDYFDHPELYAKYPGARDIGFTTDPSHDPILPDVEGAFLPGHNGNPNGSIFLNVERAQSEQKANETALHELQHYVQDKEGFNPGANPDSVEKMVAGPRVVQDAKTLSNVMAQHGVSGDDAASAFTQAAGRAPYKGALDIANTKTPQQIANAPRDGFDAYRRNMGETESRLVERRANYTDEQRRYIDPIDSMDVHPGRQLPYTGDEPKGTIAMASGAPVGALAAKPAATVVNDPNAPSGPNAPDLATYRTVPKSEADALTAKMQAGGKLTGAERNAAVAYAFQNGQEMPKDMRMRPEMTPSVMLRGAMNDPSKLPAPVGRVGQAQPAPQAAPAVSPGRQPPAVPAMAAKPAAAAPQAPQSDLAELAAIKRGDTASVLKMQAAQNTPGPTRPPLTVTGKPPEAGSDAAMFQGIEGKYSLPDGYLGKIGAIESGNGRNMSTPLSSAKGYFQFTNGTAKAYNVDVNSTASGADGAARLAVDNRNALAKGLGVSPDKITGAQLYLAHQQGAGGALKILQNPDASMESLVGAAAAKSNGGAGLTGGQFASKWGAMYDRSTMGNRGGLPGTSAPIGQGPGSGGAKGALSPAVPPPAPQLAARPGAPGASGDDGASGKSALGALAGGGGGGRRAPIQFAPAEGAHEADLSLAALIKRRGKQLKGAMAR